MMISIVLTRMLIPKAAARKAALPISSAAVEAGSRAFGTMAKPKYVFDADEHAGFHFLSSEDLELEAAKRRQVRDLQREIDEEFAKHWTYPISYASEEEVARQASAQEQRQAEASRIIGECAKHWTYPVSYVSEEEMKSRRADEEKEDEARRHAWE